MTLETYAARAARRYLDSLEHYGNSSPAVGDGWVSTPAYFANMLGRVMYARGDSLPGAAGEWWGNRYAAYARELLT